ncbi:MAG: hypothetical protein JWP74_3871 [Marmoricola sp.]|nr:hypothetical protein [Marmoricola sp.]
MRTSRQRWRITILAGVGFLLLQLGWIMALAPDYGIDEFDHALRASSVAEGHWQPGNDPVTGKLGRGDLIPVRADVARTVRTACLIRTYTGRFNCQPASDLGHGDVLIASAAARYNPTFYAVVGTAAAPFHGTANMYAMRAVTALLSCLLFMLTVWLAMGAAVTVWPLIALLLAALPTTVYSSAVIAPNGPELLAGLGVWVAAIAVARGPRGLQSRTGAYAALGLFSAVMANTHTLGLLLLALILGAVGLMHGPIRTLRALVPRSRIETGVLVATAVSFCFEIVWVLMSSVNAPGAAAAGIQEAPWSYVAEGAILWPLQAIGAFPMRDQHAPLAVYAVLLVLMCVFILMALRRRTGISVRRMPRPVLTLGIVAAVSFLLPAVLTVRTFHDLGPAWQGRYGTPFSVGILVIAGCLLDGRDRPVPAGRLFLLASVPALVLAQLLSQHSVVAGEAKIPRLVAVHGWNPPTTLVLVVLAALAMACWASSVRTTSTHAALLVPDEQSRPEPVATGGSR